MCDWSRFRLTENIVNLTGKMINVYDEKGDIISFPSCNSILHLADSRQIVHYVVSEEMLSELKKQNYPLKNIAIVARTGIGRDDVEISSLKWAFDPKPTVYLHRNLKNTNIKHL